MSQYQLRTDALGRKRLNLQGNLYNPGSQKFLLAQGLKKNHSVLEVGCGSGSMTTWLAEQVGNRGRVLSIDNNREQVLATERIVKKAKLRQVECREHSVFDLEQLNEKFDFIYVRFVLIHLEDPFTALIKMRQQLKKHGRLIIDEILNSFNFCHPATPVFDKRRHTIEQFMIKNGLNPNFGLTLKPLLKKLTFTSLQESLFQPVLIDATHKKLLPLVFYEMKDKLIALGILNTVEWKTLVTELEKMQKDKKYFIALSSLYQISAGR